MAAKESKRTLKQLEREKEDAEKLESIIEELNENEIALKFTSNILSFFTDK